MGMYVWYIMLRYHMYYTYVWYTYIWVISNPKQLCIVYLGAPGSTHDARIFRLVAIGDTAFSKYT